MDEALTTRVSRLGSDNIAASTMTDTYDTVNRSFLQPKMKLLGANFEKLKSTLLLVLNVIIYTKLVNERTGPLAAVELLVKNMLRSKTDRLAEHDDFENNIKDSIERHQETTDFTGKASNTNNFPNQTHRTSRFLSSRKKDPAAEVIIQYGDLISHLLDQVVTAEDKIGHGICARLMNAVIESHKRETGLLSQSYGVTLLKENMRGKIWSLAEMEMELLWKSEIEGAANPYPDRPSDLASTKVKRDPSLPLDITTYSSNVTDNDVLKINYEASEPIIFDDDIPLAFTEPIDRIVHYKYPAEIADAWLKESRSGSDESCIHENVLLGHGKTHAITQLSDEIKSEESKSKHSCAMHGFLNNTDDPFTGLQRDRLLKESLPAHQGLLPDRRIHSSMVMKSTASSTQKSDIVSPDLLALTSDMESLATESQATSEGERWLDSASRVIERER